MSEAWQKDPRRVAEKLIERGSQYDVGTLEMIYDEDQYLLILASDGSVQRLGREENLTLFRSWEREGAPPLLSEAEFLHVEIASDNAVILLRRKMRQDEPSRLYELRFRRRDDFWTVTGETVCPWVVNGA